MDTPLAKGTVLDERYSIESVLGQGGFGITYAARNIRLGLTVAVKELFWKGHSRRDPASGSVELLNEKDLPAFEEQKARFLREARIIRDFSEETAIVHVFDYFEENGTAYIVMEYVQGSSLEKAVQSSGKMDPTSVLKAFLPLTECLEILHKSGVIHRDISPDNLLLPGSGKLKLIDFGAARDFQGADSERLTSISKNCYSPPEQLDKNGKQGPWTDVYALCASMYYCITTTPPESAVQRMFLDDLKTPSELGIEIDGAMEAILMKGLSMHYEKRYASMEELAAAIRDVLPGDPLPKPKPRMTWILIAAIVCLAALLTVWIVSSRKPEDRFRNIETERFVLTASEYMSVAEYAAAQEVLTEHIRELAGDSPYLVEVDGNRIYVTLPYALFENRDPAALIDDLAYSVGAGGRFSFIHEIKTVWEDPSSSLLAGEHQVKPEDVPGAATVLEYRIREYASLTKGQVASVFIDMKERLETLGVPYAFGTTRDNPANMCVKLPSRVVNAFVAEALCGHMVVCGKHGYLSRNLASDVGSLTRMELEDGSFSLVFTPTDSYAERLYQTADKIRADGEDTLYLCTNTPASMEAVSQIPLSEVVPPQEGPLTLAFRQFRFEETSVITEENLYLLDLIAHCFEADSLPGSVCLETRNEYDETGALLLEEDFRGDLTLTTSPARLEAEQLAETISRETGCFTYVKNEDVCLFLDFPVDEQLASSAAAVIPDLITRYFRDERQQALIYLIDPQKNARLWLSLVNVDWKSMLDLFQIDFHDYAPWKYGRFIFFNIDDPDGILEPYTETLTAWFDSLPEDMPS